MVPLFVYFSSNKKESFWRFLKPSSWIMIETESSPSPGGGWVSWQQRCSSVLLLKEHPSCTPWGVLCSYGHPLSLATLPCMQIAHLHVRGNEFEQQIHFSWDNKQTLSHRCGVNYKLDLHSKEVEKDKAF